LIALSSLRGNEYNINMKHVQCICTGRRLLVYWVQLQCYSWSLAIKCSPITCSPRAPSEHVKRQTIPLYCSTLANVHLSNSKLHRWPSACNWNNDLYSDNRTALKSDENDTSRTLIVAAAPYTMSSSNDVLCKQNTVLQANDDTIPYSREWLKNTNWSWLIVNTTTYIERQYKVRYHCLHSCRCLMP